MKMLSHNPIRIIQIVAGFIVCFVLAAAAGAQFLELTDEFPVPGSRYDGPGSVYYPGAIVEVELVSLSLQGCTPLCPVPTTTASGGLYYIDSFFDVFTELSIDGGEIDSFFDVFVEIDMEIEIPDIAFTPTAPATVAPPPTPSPVPSLAPTQVPTVTPTPTPTTDPIIEITAGYTIDAVIIWLGEIERINE